MPIPVVRGLSAGCVLGLTLLTALPAFAAEKMSWLLPSAC